MAVFSLSVSVVPSGGCDRVESVQLSEGGDIFLRLRVKAPPEQGKANGAVEKVVAAFLQIPPGRVRLVLGQTRRSKVLQVDADQAAILKDLRGRL